MGRNRSGSGGLLGRMLPWAVPLVISAAILWFLYRNASTEAIRTGLVGVRWPWLAGFLLLSLAEPILRGLRWREFTNSCGRFACIKAMFIGKATNNLLPFRAGDAIRAQYSRDVMGVPYSRSVASLFAEMAADGFVLCILGLCFAILTSYGNPAIIAAFGGGAGLVVLAVAILAIRRRSEVRSPSGRVRLLLHKISLHVSSIASGSSRWRATAWSLAIWAHAIAASYCGLRMCLPTVTPGGVLASIVFVYFSVLIPSAPGFMGTYHAAVAGSMALMGYGLEEYPLAPVLIHGLQYIPQTAIGLMFGLRYMSGNNWREALSSLRRTRATLREGVD